MFKIGYTCLQLSKKECFLSCFFKMQKNIKKIIIYSTAQQIGYAFLLLSIWPAKALLFQLLIIDSINKIGLFTLLAHIENKTNKNEIIEKINKPQSKKYIYLYNKLGKIRLTIESLLECEQAYCVVFYSIDDLIFTPNPGETLTLIIDNDTEVPVYYPNASFSWIDGEKQLMILFKTDE